MYRFDEKDYIVALPSFVFIPSAVGFKVYDTSHTASNDPAASVVCVAEIQKEEILDSEYSYEYSKPFPDIPEYAVSTKHELSKLTPDEIKDDFCRKLVGVALLSGYSAEATIDQIVRKGKQMNSVLDWLEQAGFFTAPASSIYHQNYPGGLLEHTLETVYQILDLWEVPIFHDHVDIVSAVKVALVHDWCKIGLYEQYMKNVKNEATGVWEKVPVYKRSDAALPFGHGVESLMKAQTVFKLSTEEALAIRWHMGEYNVAPNEMNDLHQANEKYPLVYMLQFADRLASTENWGGK